MDAEAWGAFFEDMDRLADGYMPDGSDVYVDDDGRRWGGILNHGQGDGEQICYHWVLQHYSDMDEVCPFCRANRSTRPYTNLQENAEWRPTTNLSNEVDMDELTALLIDPKLLQPPH